MGKHRWSGWPGAFCLYCGAEDPMEIAIAENWFDPIRNKWDTEEHRLLVEKADFCKETPDDVDPYSLPYPLDS